MMTRNDWLGFAIAVGTLICWGIFSLALTFHLDAENKQRHDDNAEYNRKDTEWRMQVQRILKYGVSDRWKHSQDKESWEQFYKANPDVKVPENFTPFSPIVPDPNVKMPKLP